MFLMLSCFQELRMIILLFLLVFSSGRTWGGAAWKCPEISEERRGVEISCNCEIAHTLRSVEEGGGQTVRYQDYISGVTASSRQAQRARPT